MDYMSHPPSSSLARRFRIARGRRPIKPYRMMPYGSLYIDSVYMTVGLCYLNYKHAHLLHVPYTKDFFADLAIYGSQYKYRTRQSKRHPTAFRNFDVISSTEVVQSDTSRLRYEIVAGDLLRQLKLDVDGDRVDGMFTILPLSICDEHQNMLLFDHPMRQIHRIEPHGVYDQQFTRHSSKHDFYHDSYVDIALRQFLHDLLPTYTYKNNSSSCVQFWTSAHEACRRIHPGGFCITWCIVVIDMFLDYLVGCVHASFEMVHKDVRRRTKCHLRYIVDRSFRLGVLKDLVIEELSSLPVGSPAFVYRSKTEKVLQFFIQTVPW